MSHSIICSEHLDSTDILANHPEIYLQGRHFGLLCHRASVTRDGSFLADKLFAWAQQHDQTFLTALFSPEHGLLGDAEAGTSITSTNSSRWNCPIYSLHGEHKQPTPSMLDGLDVLVIDLHEIGVRCFTYLSTVQLVLEAAARARLPVIVLDHPNPLQFWGAQGPVVQEQLRSFIGLVDTPFLHGTSIGTIAQTIAARLATPLTVIKCSGAEDIEAALSTRFAPPSPNLPTLDAVYAYPITVFLEGTNYSEGRGTDHPFQYIGAPWVNGMALAERLNAHHLSGISFTPITFTPHAIKGKADNPKHMNSTCFGVCIELTNPALVDPLATAYLLLQTLFELYPTESEWISYNKRFMIDLLVGTSDWRTTINLGAKHGKK